MRERETSINVDVNEATWKEFMKRPKEIEKVREVAFNSNNDIFLRLRALEICLAPDVKDLGYVVKVSQVDDVGSLLPYRPLKMVDSFCLSEQFKMRKLIEEKANNNQILLLADQLPKYIKKTE